jgi:hypothetical protein
MISRDEYMMAKMLVKLSYAVEQMLLVTNTIKEREYFENMIKEYEEQMAQFQREALR